MNKFSLLLTFFLSGSLYANPTDWREGDDNGWIILLFLGFWVVIGLFGILKGLIEPTQNTKTNIKTQKSTSQNLKKQALKKRKISTKEFCERIVSISLSQMEILINIINKNKDLIEGLNEFRPGDKDIWTLVSLYNFYFCNHPETRLDDHEDQVIRGYSQILFIYTSLEESKKNNNYFLHLNNLNYQEFQSSWNELEDDFWKFHQASDVSDLHYNLLAFFFSDKYKEINKETLSFCKENNIQEFIEKCSDQWRESSKMEWKKFGEQNQRPKIFPIDNTSMHFFKFMKNYIGIKD